MLTRPGAFEEAERPSGVPDPAPAPLARPVAGAGQPLTHPVRPPAWVWVHVGVAALAMVLTLPGRTHGLGLFTEPLLKSLSLDRESYAFMNLWATLLGAVCCIPCGWLLDRFGTRAVFLAVTVSLGATVVGMAYWQFGPSSPLSMDLPGWMGGAAVHLVVMVDLFLFLLLTRGLGQSALSVVSLALIGRSAGRRSGLAMGLYAFLTTAGFLTAFVILGEYVKSHRDEWRPAWAGIGFTVVALGLVGGLLVRNRFLAADPGQPFEVGPVEPSSTFAEALRSPTFWTFSLATSFYGMVVAGTSLFNQSILEERGFDTTVFVAVTRLGIPVGLAANLLVGWLATRWPLSRLMALATGLLAVALLSFPYITTTAEVFAYAGALSAAGGAITVCFFTVYRQAFGPARLGSIQGVAQMLTVLFSAVGPLLFASTKVRLDSYSPLFPVFAAIALVLALITWAAGLPKPRPAQAAGNTH